MWLKSLNQQIMEIVTKYTGITIIEKEELK